MAGQIKLRNIHAGLKNFLRAQNTGFGMASGSRSIFVDGVNGSDGYAGFDDPASAKATIGAALSIANAWDVIYVAPNAWTSGNLWMGTPYRETATDLSIAYAKQGLALVGIGHQGLNGPPYGTVIQSYAGTTTPTLYVHAPMVAIENLGFYDSANTQKAGIFVYGDTAGTSEGALCTIFNCYFHTTGYAASMMEGGAIQTYAAWGVTIDTCVFQDCKIGIMLNSGDGTAGREIVRNCDFLTRQLTAAGIKWDIAAYSCQCVLIDNCRMAHLVPVGSRYITFDEVRQGLMSNIFLGNLMGEALTVGNGGTACAAGAGVGYANVFADNALCATTTF